MRQLTLATALLAASSIAFAQDAKPSIAGDNDRLDGDHLTLRTTVATFFEVGKTGASRVAKCAPAGAKLVVTHDMESKLYLRFLRVDADTPKAKEFCADANMVSLYTTYEVTKADLAVHDFKRTGVAFGALVVPFKFRLGDKEIVSSSTVAPYLGYRTGWLSSMGLTFTPIVSAGLGLVPVTDPATSTTETKSAFSFATGLVLGSSKNDAFQAGVLIGRDVLGKRDRTLDPGSKKAWISLYVGYTISQN